MELTCCPNSIPFLLLTCISLLATQVSAYYCDHDLCATDQYCCGDNLCCDYVYSLWYFWVGVAFLILIILACGAFYRFNETRGYVVVPYFQPWNEQKSQNQSLVKGIEIDPNLPAHSNYSSAENWKSSIHPMYKGDGNMRSPY